MALQWIIGPAGSGKTGYIMQQVSRTLQDNPRKRIILIVPEQASFQYQYSLLTEYGIKGAATLDVLSFQRLARRVMQNRGGSALHVIDGLGKRILLRRILQSDSDQYPYLGKAIRKPGYLMELGDMLQELKRYRVSPEQLEAAAEERKEATDSYSCKLRELSQLYLAYEDTVSGDRIDYDDILNYLIQELETDILFSDTEFWVDDFYDFTPQEYRILQLLMEQAEQVHISLCLDNSDRNPARDSVFSGASYIRDKLTCMSFDSGVTMKNEIVFQSTRRWEKVPVLQSLEQHYFQMLPYVYSEDTEGLYLTEAQNRQSEADAVARNIRRLCREEGYRYRDFAVLTRGDQYDVFLQTAFRDYDIPFFMDEKATLREHPLTEFLLGLLSVAEQGWSYQSVFRALKTGLLSGIISVEETNLLENYVLQYGIQGSAWYREEAWNYGFEINPDQNGRMDLLRRAFSTPIRRFQLETEGEHTAAHFIQKIYELMEETGIPGALEKMTTESATYHLSREGQLHQQIWERLAELFDVMDNMLAEETISREDFTVLLSSAFDTMDLGMLPSSLDQVFVGALSHSRSGNIRVAFVLGLNEGVFPQKKGREIYFGESERQRLADVGIAVSGNPDKKRNEEQFLIYLAMTRASEQLYLSWSVSDGEGKGLRPSGIVSNLRRMYPQIAVRYVQWPPMDDSNEENLVDYLSHPGKSLGLLGGHLNRNDNPSGIWADLYNWYYGEDSPAFRRLSDTLDEKGSGTACKIEDTGFFGEPLYISVSGLESYRKCPYSYFLNYGLRLKEREQYRIEAVDLGSFYHAAMEHFTNIMLDENISWEDMEEEDVVALMDRVVEELAPGLQNDILMSTGRYRYVKHRIRNTLNRSALHLMEHGKCGSFTPVAVEADFGYSDSEIPAFEIALEDGSRMYLRGKIDRVEEAQADNCRYLRVVDYKSGSLALPLEDVYYGVKLQLITYLQVMLAHRRKTDGTDCSVLPAAVLYYYFRGKTVKTAGPLSGDEAREELLKNQKAAGLMVADIPAVLLADHNVQPGEKSRMLPFALKKDAQKYLNPEADDYEEPEDLYDIFTKHSSVITAEQMDMLGQHTLDKIRELGEEIRRGEMPIRPYRTAKSLACSYCDYSAICRIGTRDLQSVSPMMPALTKEEIWNRMESERKGEGNGRMDR